MFQFDETSYEFYTPVLKNNFRHFAVRFSNPAESEDGFSVLQNELQQEVKKNNARAFRVRKLPPSEVLVYFVTKQNDIVNWKALIKQILKNNHVDCVGITAIGLSNMEVKGRI